MKKDFSYYRKVFGRHLTHYAPKRDVDFETKNGFLSCSNKDRLIGKHLSVRRDYEFDFINDCVALPRGEGLAAAGENNAVVDIGANIGMIAIAMLREKYFRRAVAFEPAPENFRLLKNVDRNDLSGRIDCLPFALSSATGK